MKNTKLKEEKTIKTHCLLLSAIITPTKLSEAR